MKVLNGNLLKNEEFKGQPEDVVKIHEEIGTLKSTMAKFVGGTKRLDKLLRYYRCPTNRFGNGYKGQIYVHDEDIVVCYFCAKVGHMMSKCKVRPRKDASNAFKTNKRGPKEILVPKKKIIYVVDVLYSRQ